MKGMLLNSFYEASITVISTSGNDKTAAKKEKKN
jgi:hypothetical protein